MSDEKEGCISVSGTTEHELSGPERDYGDLEKRIRWRIEEDHMDTERLFNEVLEAIQALQEQNEELKKAFEGERSEAVLDWVNGQIKEARNAALEEAAAEFSWPDEWTSHSVYTRREIVAKIRSLKGE